MEARAKTWEVRCMLRIVLNGQAREVAGGTVLEALEEAGVHVPRLCHDERLAPVGACRLCLVEIEGCSRPLAACTTAVADGMVVHSHTPALEAERRTILRLLAAHCPAPPEGMAENDLLRELRAHGLEGSMSAPDPALVDESHPHIRVDMNRCILCYRCERICDDLQGQFTWGIWNRGAETRMVPDSGTTLRESSCVSCGACVDSCPSGALEDRSIIRLGAPARWTRTTCPYCGVGCEMKVGTREGRIVDVRPVLDAPVSRGHLCSKGRYAFGFVDAPDRPAAPMIREGGGWRSVSWDEAITVVAERLARIVSQRGPDAVAVLGSARATNEENYLAQKVARIVIGTNNVDCCARVCHAPSAAALKAMLGTGAATNSFADIECARTILVCGSNATSCHPIVGARIRQAALRGANLVVMDPRRTELAELADVHLAPRPGTDLLLMRAMAQVIFEEGLLDEEFVATRVDGLEEFRAFVEPWTPERVAETCGVSPGDIRRAVRLYAGERPAMSLHGLGLTEHVHGTDTVKALVNLALLTGNVGRPGTGVNPLRGQNNVQGAAHMGCDPRSLTGMVAIDAGRARFEEVWGAPIPTQAGLDLMEMMAAAREGKLAALWAIGYDVYLTNPGEAQTRAALASLELLVVQDLFLNETARELAHVFLPVAASFEKEGTFMNGERRIQRVRRAVEPPAGQRTDWEILCAVARAMGRGQGFGFASAQEIWEEIRAVWPAGAGVTYARLEQGGLQWPCPQEDHPGTERLHEQAFAHGPRARLQCVEPATSTEVATAEYPYLLITGRDLYQFNAGTMTARTDNLVLRPRDVLEMAPEDGRRLGLRDGDVVRVASRHGQTELPVQLRDEIPEGELFATFHSAAAFVNRVLGDGLDAITHTPEYKRTAVRITRLGA
jgi:formate dehydrogenase major subunit